MDDLIQKEALRFLQAIYGKDALPALEKPHG